MVVTQRRRCALLAAVAVVLAWPQSGAGRPAASRLIGRPYTRLEFRDLRCGGTFDRRLVAQLTIVCRDCYTIHREPELFGLCRQDCFGSRFFDGCLQAMRIVDPQEVDRLHRAAKQLQG